MFLWHSSQKFQLKTSNIVEYSDVATGLIKSQLYILIIRHTNNLQKTFRNSLFLAIGPKG